MAGFLSRLFGGARANDAAPEPAATVEHAGFAITPDPGRTGGGWRIGAVIAKGDRTHRLIRADVIADRDAAVEASVAKARQVIDEQGDRLFG